MSDENEFVALHVFYAANANPMLTRCVRPLIAEMRAEKLIDQWFFIRYWLEGPHLRLRLKPAPGVDPDMVESRARTALEQFLDRRPALYEEDRNDSAEIYRNLFLAEYSQQQWDAEYGEDGEMPFRDNNSIARFPYEREFSRYGGPTAMLLSEEHFEFSSDMVLHTLATTSVNLRTILLGQATLQTLLLSFAMLRSPVAVRSFFERYRLMWEASYQEPSDDQHGGFDKAFGRMKEQFVVQVRHIVELVEDPSRPATETERSWVAQGSHLREKIAELHEAGELSFREGASPGLDASLGILLSSYVHMSNNRLGVSILDEIYISYTVVKAIDALGAVDLAATSV